MSFPTKDTKQQTHSYLMSGTGKEIDWESGTLHCKSLSKYDFKVIICIAQIFIIWKRNGMRYSKFSGYYRHFMTLHDI